MEERFQNRGAGAQLRAEEGKEGAKSPKEGRPLDVLPWPLNSVLSIMPGQQCSECRSVTIWCHVTDLRHDVLDWPMAVYNSINSVSTRKTCSPGLTGAGCVQEWFSSGSELAGGSGSLWLQIAQNMGNRSSFCRKDCGLWKWAALAWTDPQCQGAHPCGPRRF